MRATKGQHTKSLDVLDQTNEPKRRASKKGASGKKAGSQEVTSAAEEEAEVIRCVCGEQGDDGSVAYIACDQCSVWQHNICMGVSAFAEDTPENYWCEECKPENHTELLEGMERGEKPWIQRQLAFDEEQKRPRKGGKRGKAKRSSDVKAVSRASSGQPPSSGVDSPAAKAEKKEPISRAGSTKRKTRDDTPDAKVCVSLVRNCGLSTDGVKAPQSKVRKVSGPPKKGTNTEQSPLMDLPEGVDELESTRQGPAKYLQKMLLGAISNAVDAGTYAFQAGESVESKSLRLALEVERAVHDTHPKESYGPQIRTISSNIKTNQTLCDRLLSRDLSPAGLAAMSTEEMATKELQREIAEMKARADKQSIMVTEEGPRMRRTHKGDEMIEDNYAANVSSDLMSKPVARRREILDPNADMAIRSRENTPGSPTVELPESIDDYRSRDDIRGHAEPKQPLNVDTKSTTPDLRKSSTQNTDFDFNKVFSSTQTPTSAHPVRRPSAPAPPPSGPGEDPDVDRLLRDDDDPPESPPYSPTDYVADPTIIWRGKLTMNSIADFPCVARHIGGADTADPSASLGTWNDIIPADLTVAGRIDHEKAVDYLCSLRYSAGTDVSVIALTPVGERAAEDFNRLFDYFHSKNRYGVVGNRSYGNVRDTYLVPVEAGVGNVPEFMQNLVDSKLPETRTERMILIAFVIRSTVSPVTHGEDGAGSPSVGGSLHRALSNLSGPAMSPMPPNNGFSPSPHSSHAPPQQPSTQQVAQPQQQPYTPGPPNQAQHNLASRDLAQKQGEALATQVLGPLVHAPTVAFLMPQAFQMHEREWRVIREIFEEEPVARDNLQHLSALLSARNGAAAQGGR